jgi:NO-binding membrane sensor protein with MHYT domain
VLRLYNCIVEQHDLILVGLAALVCATGAIVTFVLAGLARADGGGRRWLAAAGLVSGTSVWATHFVAMLAFDPGVPTGYDPALTLISLALPVLVGWAAFHLAAGATAWRAATGGALLGAGIMAMHYLGMAAYRLAGGLVWDKGYVAVSVGSALAFPVAAFLARRALPGFAGQAAAAGLLILGVVALHFVGMAAILVLPDPDATPEAGLVPPAVLAAAVGLGALLILCAGLAAAAQALRFRRREREEAERLRSLADATIEGLLVCDGDRIVTSNRSLRELLGRPEAWFPGRAVSEVIPDLPAAGLPRAEVTLLAADGGAIPAEVVARPFAWHGKPHRVLAVRDLRDRQEAEARIRFLAAHDPLTRLPNRAGFA